MVGEEPHETVLVEMDFKCVVWGKKSVVGDSVEFRVAGEKMDECDFRNMFGWEAQDHIDVLETDGVKQWREQR